MPRPIKNRKAQIINEYTVTVALAVTVIMAVTAIVKRSIQARIKDTKDYMITKANDAYVQTRNATAQTPARIPKEYEPYYTQSASDVTRDSTRQLNVYKHPWEGFTYEQVYKDRTAVVTNSIQLPPKDAR
ncbi:MAG TPA: hypothetical protein PL155_02585 [Candidatus Omnitrophota bacterium]|nr:hypothetical protein [Candidatus Omnitrophota bacterium]HPD84627.1 hypothetical protein [Candidatus Omnitrophota bacterium]HRZ03485.1 hypothetical protein [Candidatus Omnitrophota bacterium]